MASRQSIAEFFAGIGLIRIGLENAGWRVAFAHDIDHDKWKTQAGVVPAPQEARCRRCRFLTPDFLANTGCKFTGATPEILLFT